MLRTNNVDSVIVFAAAMEQQGFTEVGLIRYWKHVLFGWGKRKKAAIEKQKENIRLPESLADALMALATIERQHGDATKSASLFGEALEQIGKSAQQNTENLRLRKKQELFTTKINDLQN